MQIIDISLSTHSVAPIFDAVQYDSARVCGFNVEDDISSCDTVEAVFDLTQARTATASCEVDDHLVSFTIPINVTREAGQYTGTVRFLNGSTVIHAFPFKVDVSPNPSPDGNVYERAYQDMVAENARAASNNAAMESYISAYGSITPTQLTSLLSDLQSIWQNFNNIDMTALTNKIDAIDSKSTTNESNIASLQTLTSNHTSSISTINSNVSGLTTRMSTAEGKVTTLEGLADSAVYHD
jgi:hypothetical protein